MPIRPGLVVGTCLDQREVEGTEALADAQHVREEPRVAREVDAVAWPDQRVAGPERLVAIQERAPRGVTGRHACHGDAAEVDLAPPIDFADAALGYAPIGEMFTD